MWQTRVLLIWYARVCSLSKTLSAWHFGYCISESENFLFYQTVWENVIQEKSTRTYRRRRKFLLQYQSIWIKEENLCSYRLVYDTNSYPVFLKIIFLCELIFVRQDYFIWNYTWINNWLNFFLISVNLRAMNNTINQNL